MGRETLNIEVTMSVSRHNSPEDDADNARHNVLLRQIREAAACAGPGVEVYGYEQPENQWKEKEDGN